MFKNLINKTLYDKRWFMLGWSIGLIVMAGITIAFFPTIKDQMGTLFANIPKALQSVTGSPEDYTSITGYVGVGVFDLRIPMLTLTMAIILGLGLGVGEEAAGKLYQLLSQPISRPKIVLQKWLAMVGILATVHLALFGGNMIIIKLINESMSIGSQFAGVLMCYLLTLAVGSLTLGLGLALGRKGLTTLLITAYVFGGYLLTSFASQIDWLKHVEPASLFHYYHAATAVKHGYTLEHVMVLIAVTGLGILLGVVWFSNRDIGTHNA
jgi:ABC-2 type transport system permease protein